jgi:hypothetical protein
MRQAWLIQRRVGRLARHGIAASIGAACIVLGVFGLFAAISWNLGPSVEASLVYQFILALDDPERRPILAAFAVAVLAIVILVAFVRREVRRRRIHG